jgi:hypothetical protein
MDGVCSTQNGAKSDTDFFEYLYVRDYTIVRLRRAL